MSSDESEVDETGVDPMGVRIIEIMMLGALPRSDAVQALIASGGNVRPGTQPDWRLDVGPARQSALRCFTVRRPFTDDHF